MTAVAERPLGAWLDAGLFLEGGLATQAAPAEGVARAGRPHDLAVVVLTQANRPDELVRALASVRTQRGLDLQLVLVLNGALAENAARLELPRLGPSDRFIVLPENAGIPGGRNIGAAAADARVIMFLDDDAELLGPDVLATVVERFDADAGLGAMAIRLVDHEGLTQRRHVPRVGKRSALRSGEVTHFIGAACAVRAEAFTGAAGFDQRFFYAMEESDLSWRLLDAGWSLWYSADLTAFHPRTTPSRHPGHVLLTARNRFWAAWRSLPLPVAAVYVSIWTLLAVARGGAARQVLAGYRQAWAARPARRPMRWRTVARMTVLGRPPVL
ncbi:glycosyltransferase family 2 protein [Microlunatus flavus]|uniref:Glycosyltransferase, GT2 family n=1 Tax=Microlunatus flavus TaxID=1036181 RepID=A0A1H8Z3N2_9ACTN|nr:glycosyltransferase [Microlunatus flavus]SEP58867.1 Glycosyltransferase, GT2 family [Microlunatus flavus]